jgi:hypothetical protein
MNMELVLLLICLAGAVSVAGYIFWQRIKNHETEQDEWDIVFYGEAETKIQGQKKRNLWNRGGAVSKAAAGRHYAEMEKGPDRPSRSRGFGKPGMNNRSEQNTMDWQTDSLVNRIAGRRDATAKYRKKPAAPPPKKKPSPK